MARVGDVLAEYPCVPQPSHWSSSHWQKGNGDAAEERLPGDATGIEA